MTRQNIGWFLAKFLAAAGILFWLWSQAGWANAWSRVVLASVSFVAPLLTGYSLDQANGTAFVSGTTRLALPLNLRETCAGVVPFFALIIATTDRDVRTRLWGLAIGIAILYPVQVGVVSMTPFMMTPHAPWISNALDVVYTFAALGGLVALPLFLWWAWWKVT